jgi:hypothetical protein
MQKSIGGWGTTWSSNARTATRASFLTAISCSRAAIGAGDLVEHCRLEDTVLDIGLPLRMDLFELKLNGESTKKRANGPGKPPGRYRSPVLDNSAGGLRKKPGIRAALDNAAP